MTSGDDKAGEANVKAGRYTGHFAPMAVVKRGIIHELSTPLKLVAFSYLVRT
jgi:hypothetical protein